MHCDATRDVTAVASGAVHDIDSSADAVDETSDIPDLSPDVLPTAGNMTPLVTLPPTGGLGRMYDAGFAPLVCGVS